MAVVVQQKFAGSTVDQYDRALAKLGMTAEGPHIAPGLLFHYVVAIDEGVEITIFGRLARDSRSSPRKRSSRSLRK